MNTTRFFKLGTLCCLSLIAAGCQQPSRVGTTVKGAPDEVVEVLRISDDGAVVHREGRFLELVDRSDQKLVVVDFWATWCGPCRLLGPHLEGIKQKWGDDLEVVKVDVDKATAVASHLNVSSIPDVRIYRNGKQVGDFVGLMPREEIEALLKSLQ
jgi:thioredoxin 1